MGDTGLEYLIILPIFFTIIGVGLGALLDHFEIVTWWHVACSGPIIGLGIGLINGVIIYRRPRRKWVDGSRIEKD